MKNIESIKDAFDELVNNLKSSGHKIKDFIFVSDDTHAQNRLKDSAGICLLLTYPTKNYHGNSDSFTEQNDMILFVLEKDDPSQTFKDEFNQFKKLEDVMTAIISYITEKQSCGCSIFNRLNVGKMIADPEYRSFGGWNGWSLTFSI